MRIWILGPSSDPEMEAIEGLLREAGERIIYARADSAYRVAALSEPIPAGATVYRVECDGPAIPADAIVIDHHRPGDPGYGRPPEEFLPASSIGQVIAELWGPSGYRYDRHEPGDWVELVGNASYEDDYALDQTFSMGLVAAGKYEPLPLDSSDVEAVERSARDGFALIPGYGWAIKTFTAACEDGSGSWRYRIIPAEYVLCAAADHCLAAAYRGKCPGVDPDALMRWRAASRAPFRRRAILWAREQDANYRNCPYTVIPFDAMASRVDRPDLLPQKPFVLINRHGDDIAYGEEHELSVIAAHWNEKGARTVMTEGTKAEGL